MIFFINQVGNDAGRLDPDLFCFLKKLYIKAIGQLFSFNFNFVDFDMYTIKRNFTTFQNVDPKTCSIFIFY